MITFNPDTYFDPLSIALGGDYKKLQKFVDTYLAPFNELKIDGFKFNNDMLDDFTYEQVEHYVGIAPLAPIVDPDSNPIPFGRDGEVLGTGSVPRMKVTDNLNEKDIRALWKLARRMDVPDTLVKAKAGAKVGEALVHRTNSFINQISFQRDQMVSAAKIVYNSTNNPYGIALELSGRVPAANKKTISDATKKWWTDSTYATEGNAANPIKDLKDMVEAARQKGVVNCHFEVNNLYLDKILGHSAVVSELKAWFAYVGGVSSISTLAPFNRSRQIAALSDLVGKPIIERDHIAEVEYSASGKRATRQFETFEKNVVVLIPDGNIGEILTVEPIKLPGGTYADALGGKLLFTVENDTIHKVQNFLGEMTSIVAPNQPKRMWYLYPNAS